MEIINALEMSDMTNAHGVSAKELLSTEYVQTVMIKLQPGEGLKLHLTPVDVFFYVLEGAGMVEIGGEQMAVQKDQLIVSPARIPHRLWNDNDTVFRFLVVKTPRQKEKTRLL